MSLRISTAIGAGACILLAVPVLLAGCSTSSGSDKHVASVRTTGSAGPAPTASGTRAASRPRERLDMNDAEGDEMWASYDKCLADHGYGPGKGSGTGDGPKAAKLDESKRPAAEAACLVKKPLPPWQYDKANPESADFVHAVVQCLRKKGVRYVEEAPLSPGDDRRAVALGGPNNDSESISKGMQLIESCEKESMGGHG